VRIAKIGVYGGSFDPIHKGHLEVARHAMEHLKLDEVIFVPNNQNPIKNKANASAKDRLEMVRLAIADNPGFSVSDIETSRKGPSFMQETLMQLQFVRPGDYWLITGTDTLRTLTEWKNWQKILRMVRFGVAIRGHFNFEDSVKFVDPLILEKVDHVPMPPVDISSTEVRDSLKRGRPVSAWVPESVVNYIKANKLYTQ
jgi:nicotinate-nucleotide adenylyltransferase